LGNFGSKSVTLGTFTLTQTSDGAGDCDELQIDSNGNNAHFTSGSGSPFGSTLDASNGYASTDVVSGQSSGNSPTGIADDGTSQLAANRLFCQDSNTTNFPGGPAISGGFVFGE